MAGTMRATVFVEPNRIELPPCERAACDAAALSLRPRCLEAQQDARWPDIILHRRGRHNQNFLVIEVKRHVGDVEDDIVKIRDCWFSRPLLYHFGAVVAVPDGAEPGDCFVSVFTNPHHNARANTVGR
jgi:hypothetical protein